MKVRHGLEIAKRLWPLAAALLIGGCGSSSVTSHTPAPGPEGQLGVMTPGGAFDLNAPPDGWIIAKGDTSADPLGREALSNVTVDGVRALELISSAEPTVAVRHIDAMLLATPYLTWSWHLSDHGQGIHPVRIVVGFQGGMAPGGAPGNLGAALPAHDRALALVWGDTLLRRGSISLPPPDKPWEAPLYTVRGGRENTRRWWPETVDLSELYAKAWPGEDMRRVRITFIGIAAAPRMPTVRGRVSGLLLSH